MLMLLFAHNMHGLLIISSIDFSAKFTHVGSVANFNPPNIGTKIVKAMLPLLTECLLQSKKEYQSLNG